MVAVGVTVTLPSTATAPTSLSIEAPVAPDVVQLKVVVSPAVIVVGAAVKLSTVGGGSPLGSAGPVTEMPSHFPPWLDRMLIVPVLSGATEDCLSRKSQTPKPSTAAVPKVTGPGAVGPVYKVIVLSGSP